MQIFHIMAFTKDKILIECEDIRYMLMWEKAISRHARIGDNIEGILIYISSLEESLRSLNNRFGEYYSYIFLNEKAYEYSIKMGIPMNILGAINEDELPENKTILISF